MEQQLSVKLTIPIPNDSVLIKKVELENLKRESLEGKYWNMKDLEKRTGKKNEWIKDNILFVPKFKKELDINNGGFVYYPEGPGQVWSFQASKMSTFLEENFHLIFRKR